MRLYFRPLPWFSLLTVLLFAGLIALGNWQIHRLHWKLGLIAAVNRDLAGPPLPLAAVLKLGKDAEYHKVALSGRFDHRHEAYVYGIAEGAPVYHVLTPFLLADGRALIVDRGIVPEELRDPAKRRAGQVEGERQIAGVWRKPDPPGSFTPMVDRARRIWFSRDVEQMARENRLRLVAPVLIEADAAPNPGGWPKGGQTVVTFRNEHLQYAITWYALAGVLIGCYIALHISMGRLGRR